MTENLKKFSTDLQAKRLAEGITLQQIASKTRIDLKMLEAIETGDFQRMEEVYIRAFLKEYSSSVNLNSKDVLEMYDLAKKGKYISLDETEIELETATPEKKVIGFEPVHDEEPDLLHENNKNNNIYLAAGSVFILLVLIYFIFFYNNKPEFIREPGAAAVNPSEMYETSKKEIIKESATDTSMIRLDISAIEKVWMRVITDDESFSEFTLLAGESKALEGERKFSVLIGNAGGVTFRLNGKPAQFEGKKGEVKNLLVDHQGIHMLRTPPPPKNE